MITLDTSSINQEALSNIELTIEQLQRKQTILEELDAKIAPLIEDESELEEIVEAEDTRTKILHGISRLKVKLNTVHVESTEPPPVAKNIPTAQPSSAEVTPPTHSATVVSTTSNSTTLHTASVTTSPILEAATGIPETNTLPTEHTTVVSIASYPTSRLPKLSIPTFSGDPLTWQSFCYCFDSAVNSNGSLTNVQKLSYLRAQLQADAFKVVAGFPLTNTNYTESVTLLKSRFGQPHKLIAAHMQALLHQSKPTNTLSSLQSFHDSVEGHVRSLTSLGKPLDSYADKKHCGRPYSLPDSPPLPEMRMHDVVPFTVTGIDFTGALYVWINGVENKVYICLFTCATTRGVHLEIVTDLTTDTCP